MNAWRRVLVAAVACAAACDGCQKAENFECGARASDGTATFCDGTNEVCICDVQRCAVPETRCPSGFRWRFDHTGTDAGCVAAQQLRSRLATNDSKTYCPGENSLPPTCGDLAADRATFNPCGNAQLCLCGARPDAPELAVTGHVCVVRADTCPEPRLARAYDGRCVEAVGGAALTQSQLVLRPPSDPACPDAELFPRTCGIAGGDNNRSCGAGLACLCGLKPGTDAGLAAPRYSCVQADPACAGDGGTGLRIQQGACISGVDVGALELRFGNEGNCPGFDIDVFRPDAGTDGGTDAGATDAGALTCGINGEPGDQPCGANEACLCGTASGSAGAVAARFTCVRAWAPCLDDAGTGLRYRDAGCVTGAPAADLVLRFDGQACPGFDIGRFKTDGGTDAGIDAGSGPDGGPVTCGISGEPGDEPCGANEACLCGVASGAPGMVAARFACVRAWGPCLDDGGTGLRYRDAGCVTGAAATSLVLSFDGETCPGFDIGTFKPDGGADGGGS